MTIYDYTVLDMQSQEVVLEQYRGKVLLITNTASKCGFTPQFEGLESLHQKYQEQGLVILGFPCNQFGGQDPGSNDQILDFCVKNYGVSFPMHEKIEVNGSSAHPLFDYLKTEARGALGTQRIKWNFTKFLVGRDGAVIGRYAPLTKPEALEQDIERALAN
jgi:glutathione peroxidase